MYYVLQHGVRVLQHGVAVLQHSWLCCNTPWLCCNTPYCVATCVAKRRDCVAAMEYHMTGARSDLRVSSMYVPATAAVSTGVHCVPFRRHRKSAKSVAFRQAERLRRK
jgi:hypothetical protein